MVGWQGSSDASKWLLQRIDVSTADLNAVAELHNATNTNYTSQLANFFTDYACTQLKSNYASMSDAQLRSAMSALPEALREEAVRVKNNKWNDNSQWNYYEKSFRIHDYEVYSDPWAWNSKLGFVASGRLSQPTGIRAKSGDLIYILVSDNVTDSDARIFVEQIVGTGLKGTQKRLTQGFNYLTPTDDCELFITYECTNPDKPLSNYPNIKIHIVGGTCNGAFDMSRGHRNNDWMWLKEYMFKDTYLHLHSKYHMVEKQKLN